MPAVYTVVGGLLAVLGSVFVNRREVTRRHRISALTELLPALEHQMERQRQRYVLHGTFRRTQELQEPMRALARNADVASRSDRRHVDAMRESLRLARNADPWWNLQPNEISAEVQRDAARVLQPLLMDRLLKEIDQYLTFLRRKVR
jgi:hypothetical protein